MTIKKKAGKAVYRGEQASFLDAALQNMPVGFCIWDDDLRLLLWNQAYLDIHHMSGEELYEGISLREVILISVKKGNAGGKNAEKHYQKRAASLIGDKSGEQTIIRRPFSDDRTVEVKQHYVVGMGWIVVHEDITEKLKNAEISQKRQDEIRLQNLRIDAAMESIPHGMAMFDADRRLVFSNKAFVKINRISEELIAPGVTREALIQSSIKNGFVSDGVDGGYFGDREKAINEHLHSAVMVKLTDGQVVAATHHPFTDGSFVLFQQDITDLHQKQKLFETRSEELRQQNMRLDATLESIPHGLAMFDSEERLVACNRAYAEINMISPDISVPGTPRSKLLESSLENGFDPKDGWQAYVDGRKKVIASRVTSIGEINLTGGRTIAFGYHPTTDGGWVSFQQDISEQHRKEELVNARSRELERQNMLFNAAVNNMSHGLSMFDANCDLVVCNEPHARMYGLPVELTEPGTSFWDMIEHDAKSGMVSIADPEERRNVLEEIIRSGKPLDGPVTMINGHIMHIRHQPLADGGWLATHEDITERHRSEELIHHLARFDALTDLPNRTAFLDKMRLAESEIDAGQQVAVLCIDLDNFKPVNDNFGHATGDAVLKMVAERINECVGDCGCAARLGGDEFAAIVGPIESADEAGEIANNIIQSISKPFQWEGLEITIGASIGIVVAPRDGDSSDVLLHNGDLALYRAKNEGRGRFCFFEQEMGERQKKRRSIEVGLKLALERGELELNYQPILSLDRGQVSCCEALMRWNNADGVVASPAEFIPVAEETGLIKEIGYWALQSACATAVQWPANIRVAVNVSPVQFKNNDLVGQVTEALARSGLEASRLELEITESLFLDDNEHNLKILHALREFGVRIALDDFGTGYSSLSYLRSFPFDKIKIDRSFISSLADQPDSIAIVKAVVDLGARLGMSSTAEGIETEAQLEAVRKEGCVEVQGYLFSPPLPATAIDDFIRATAPKTVALTAHTEPGARVGTTYSKGFFI